MIVIFSFRAEPTWEDMLAFKDEALALAKQAIAFKDEALASKDKVVEFAEEALKHAGGRIAALNTKLLVAKGLVEPRCAIMLIPLFERTSVFVSVNGHCRYAMEEAEKRIREALELKCGNSKGRANPNPKKMEKRGESIYNGRRILRS